MCVCQWSFTPLLRKQRPLVGVDVATVKNMGEKQQTLRLCIDSDDSDVLEKMRTFVLELLFACQIR